MSDYMMKVAEILREVQSNETLGHRALRKICRGFTSPESLVGNGYIELTKRKTGETYYRLTKRGSDTIAEYEKFMELCEAAED